MRVAYTLYIEPPRSRSLDAQREEFSTIDYLVHSLVEDMKDLLPPGYTIEMSADKEEA